MAIIYAEGRFPAHMDSHGEEYRDVYGIPDTAPFDEYERADGLAPRQSSGRHMQSKSAPFTALAVLIVGGIAAASAIALVF